MSSSGLLGAYLAANYALFWWNVHDVEPPSPQPWRDLAHHAAVLLAGVPIVVVAVALHVGRRLGAARRLCYGG